MNEAEVIVSDDTAAVDLFAILGDLSDAHTWDRYIECPALAVSAVVYPAAAPVECQGPISGIDMDRLAEVRSDFFQFILNVGDIDQDQIRTVCAGELLYLEMRTNILVS